MSHGSAKWCRPAKTLLTTRNTARCLIVITILTGAALATDADSQQPTETPSRPSADVGLDTIQHRAITDAWILDHESQYVRRRQSKTVARVPHAVALAQRQHQDGQYEVAVDTNQDGRDDLWVFFEGAKPAFVEGDRFNMGWRDLRIDLRQRPWRISEHHRWFIEPPVKKPRSSPVSIRARDIYDWAAVSPRYARTRTQTDRLAGNLIVSLSSQLEQLSSSSQDKEDAQSLDQYTSRALAMQPDFLAIHRRSDYAHKLLFKGGFRVEYKPYDLDGRDGKEVVVGYAPSGIAHIQFYENDWQKDESFLVDVTLKQGQVSQVILGTRNYFLIDGYWVRVSPLARQAIATQFLLPAYRQFQSGLWYDVIGLWQTSSRLAALIGDFSLDKNGVPTGDLTGSYAQQRLRSSRDLWSFDVEGLPASALLLVARDMGWQRQTSLLTAYTTLANHAANQRDFDAALHLLEYQLRLADKLHNTVDKVGTLNSMSGIHRHLGNYDLAIDSLFDSLDLESTLGFALDVAKNLQTGTVAGELSHMQRKMSVRWHAMALNRGCKLATIAALYADLGEQPKADSYLAEAERIIKSLGEHRYAEADLLNLRANWDLRAGRHDIAESRLQHALELAQQQLEDQKQHDRGLELYNARSAMQLFTVPGERIYLKVGIKSKTHPLSYQALTASLLGELYLQRALAVVGNRTEQHDQLLMTAKKWQQQALAWSEESHDSLGMLTGRLRLAKIALQQRRLDTASTLLEQVLRESERQNIFETHWQALAMQGEVHHRKGRTAEAITAYEQAAAEIESLRARIRSEPIRHGFFGSKQGVYQQLVSLYHANGRADREAADRQTWSCIERAKARTLLDLIAGRHLEIKGEEVAEVTRDYPLLFQRMRAQRKTDQSTSAERGSAAHAEFMARIADRPQLQEVASLKTVNPVELSALQRHLQPHDLLIEYFVTPDTLFAAVVSPNDLKVLNISGYGREELRADVDKLRTLFQDRSGHYAAPARRLYERLLAPCLAGRRDVTHLCIVPGDSLHYLPFHALMSARDRFVIEDYLVSYAPSASALVYSMNRRRDDSTYGTGETLIVASPESRLDFGPLPFATVEGERILDLARKPKRMLVGSQAVETSVTSGLQAARHFHFAGHTDLTSTAPMHAALLCAEDIDEDGRLEVREIFELQLQNCELAVLSACETRLGSWSRGDEIVGLERAFLRAGVPTVVASLWKVEDAATSLLMEEFYRNLWQRQLDCGEALRQAQLAVLRDPQQIRQRRRELADRIALRGLKLSDPQPLSADPSIAPLSDGPTHPVLWAAFLLSGSWHSASPTK
jgi:CHAT domain-containing protein/tetratricopeptide (TPR) repeat protein